MIGTESEAGMTRGSFAIEGREQATGVSARLDAEAWAADEAALCAALVRQGKDGRTIGPLIVAALRATDALAHRSLPADIRAALEASAWDALRTLARTDGRQRRGERRLA